jgi:PAS domain S-box-containing protein
VVTNYSCTFEVNLQAGTCRFSSGRSAEIIGLAVIYFIVARLSLLLAFGQTNVCPVWPPTGLALAAVFHCGYRVWPGIAMGAFGANVVTFISNGLHPVTALPLSLFIGAGNTLEALAGFFLVSRFIAGRNPFFQVRDFFVYVTFGAAAAAAVSAAVGTSGLYFAGITPLQDVGYLWLTWWGGDVFGALIITPFLLTWLTRDLPVWSALNRLEFLVVFLLLSGYLLFLFTGSPQSVSDHGLYHEYLVVPLLLWATFRLGQHGATAAMLVTALVATWYTVKGLGPFAHETTNDSLLALVAFLSFNALIVLSLAALQKERDRFEETLKSNEAFLTSIIEHLPNMVFVKEAGNLRFVRMNKAGEELLGYPRESLIGKNDYDFFPENEADFFTENDRKVLINKQLVDIPRESIQTKHKGTRYLHTRKIPLLDSRGEPLYLLGISEDITEQQHTLEENRALESRLRQAQKMEAIGTLAGGIAHDFNNILSAILGYAELAEEEAAEGKGSLRKYLREILHGANRARDLVRQILMFSRKTDRELHPVNVETVVTEVLKLLRSTIPTTIEIRQDISSGCAPVLADSTEIHQVVMNLCTNAYQAMRETGGILGVSLHPVLLGAEDIDGMHLQPGQYLKLEISDTGGGINEDTRNRIFEPYFTTKAKGEGTGLGLAVVHGIVTNLRGDIVLRSEPGKGTVFAVYLPAVAQVQGKSSGDGGEEQKNGGGERLLVVDDDPSIVEVYSQMFTGLGYEVTAFTDSVAALDEFRSEPAGFDLIVTDMTMPVMTGAELTGKVLAIKPGMPIVLCTGFSDLIDEEKAKSIGISAFVSKPASRKQMAATVRMVLDNS